MGADENNRTPTLMTVRAPGLPPAPKSHTEYLPSMEGLGVSGVKSSSFGSCLALSALGQASGDTA